MGDFEMRVRSVNDIPVVGLGKNAPGKPVTPEQVVDLFKDTERGVVVDLSGVLLLNSSTLGKFITFSRQAAAQHKQLRFCGASPEVREVFGITKLDKMLQVVVTLDEAIASM